MKASKASAFLENMKIAQGPAEPAAPSAHEKPRAGKDAPKTRRGLKHIGGYCDPDTVEKFAVLRARLSLDNSECLTLAIQELYNRQKAKRAFSD